MLIVNKEIESNFESVHQFVLKVIDLIDKEKIVKKQNTIFKINVMLREVLNNAVEHGNKFDENRMVYCRIELDKEIFTFIVRDEGEGCIKDQFYNVGDGFTMKLRSRGLDLITKYGFKYKFNKNEIVLKYMLDKEM